MKVLIKFLYFSMIRMENMNAVMILLKMQQKF